MLAKFAEVCYTATISYPYVVSFVLYLSASAIQFAADKACGKKPPTRSKVGVSVVLLGFLVMLLGAVLHLGGL